jgi:hypothetical protein
VSSPKAGHAAGFFKRVEEESCPGEREAAPWTPNTTSVAMVSTTSWSARRAMSGTITLASSDWKVNGANSADYLFTQLRIGDVADRGVTHYRVTPSPGQA